MLDRRMLPALSPSQEMCKARGCEVNGERHDLVRLNGSGYPEARSVARSRPMHWPPQVDNEGRIATRSMGCADQPRPTSRARRKARATAAADAALPARPALCFAVKSGARVAPRCDCPSARDCPPLAGRRQQRWRPRPGM